MSHVTETTHRSPGDYAILAMGFRPFYLLAGVFAVLALPLWLAVYTGVLQTGGHLISVAWHSHEMVFGFTSAVIAGFLLTAVRNWTSRPTPTGVGLALLAALWLLARILMLTGPGAWAMVVDIAFLPVLAMVVGIPILRSRNARNYKVLAVLLLLTMANGLYHMTTIDVVTSVSAYTVMIAALDIITILMAVVGGRVIPAFTANAIPTSQPRQLPLLEAASMLVLILIVPAGIMQAHHALPNQMFTILLAIAVLTQIVRWLLWTPLSTWRNPLLVMLPVAYLWIPLSLALRALVLTGVVAPGIAIHALTLGAIGGLTLAMMMRSALGHTGRTLQAGPFEIGAFALVQLAALTRLSTGFVPAPFYQHVVMFSGLLWSLAFAVFLMRYAPLLCQPRIDGKPG